MDLQLKKIEKALIRPITVLFNLLAEQVSYNFSVAFISSLGGFLIAAYIALFLYSTVNFAGSGSGHHFIILFSVPVCTVYAIGTYLHFGALYRLGVRFVEVRMIRRCSIFCPGLISKSRIIFV